MNVRFELGADSYDISIGENIFGAPVRKLLAERQEFYSQADFQIDTTDWSPLQIVNEICDYLKSSRRGG